MIETKEGIKNIERIISVPGVDVVYFGIFDLSMEYGFKVTDPKLIKIIQYGMNKCKKYKKEIGLMNIDSNSLELSKKYNAKFILNGIDTNLLAQIAQNKS